ncbi:MAG: SH3 domain-containing protein [Phycisphaerales bacterium]|nr:SH3 domain-containing protein [Phycisphaerales bacterium]
MPVSRLFGALLVVLAFARVAAAQDAAAWWAVVTADDVYIRTAPSVESSYPFMQVKTGNVVKVAQDSAGWAKVLMVGPTFKGAIGYVRADRKVTLAADGRTAEVTARTDVFAPNISARSSPDSSWKSVARVDPGRTLAVLETIEGQRDTVYKVPMPSTGEGWINLTFLRRATDAELAAAGVQPTPPPPPVTPPATDGTTSDGTASDGTASDGTAAATPTGTTAPAGTDTGSSAETAPPPDAGTEPASDTAPATGETVTLQPGEVVIGTDGTTTVVEEIAPRIKLEDLEAMMKVLMKEDPENAEVGVLREAYLEYAVQPDTSASKRDFALARAEQLQLRVEVQERLQRLRRLRDRADIEVMGIREVVVAAENRQAYAAIGRFNASSVFDGKRLPLLFRVQDPAGGQTVAYVAPAEGLELFPLLGQLVGVVGTARYDQALRVNVVTPVRVDILTRAPGS